LNLALYEKKQETKNTKKTNSDKNPALNRFKLNSKKLEAIFSSKYI